MGGADLAAVSQNDRAVTDAISARPQIGVIMDNLMPQLDTRFSEPNAQATPWETTHQALEAAQLFWITTVRSNGRPHVTPLVAVWIDETLYFSTGATEQKWLNLTSNPNVVLTTGSNQWDHGLDVMVEGRAERVTDRTTLERLAAAWATKWDGQWQYRVTDTGFAHGSTPAQETGSADPGEDHVFAVKPTKILTFARGGFSQTRYLPAQ